MLNCGLFFSVITNEVEINNGIILAGSPMLDKILSCGDEMRVHCPSPMTNGTHHPYDFQDIPDSTFAQQLTRMDTVSLL